MDSDVPWVEPFPSGRLVNHERDGTFTALLGWPDIDDPRYSDEFGVVMKLGPDGRPPVEIRDVQIFEGRKYIDTYVLEEGLVFLPDEVYYVHVRAEIVDQ